MKWWKRTLTLVLALVICMFLLPAWAMAASRDFTIENGVLTWYSGDGGDVVIPDGVTEIGSFAFWKRENLESVTMPGTVTRIGESAFNSCTNLTDVVFSENVTSIGKSAFYACSSLTSANIPEGVTSIEDWTFGECANLSNVSLPDTVSKIGYASFYLCTSLSSISIPEDVSVIDEWAFGNCTSLTSVDLPDGITSIGECAFYECSSLSNMSIPTGSKTFETLQETTFTAIFPWCYALEQMDAIPWADLAQRVDANQSILEAWINPGQYISPQSERITKLSHEITAGLDDNYEKTQAIAAWVSENIEYDSDYINGQKETVAVDPEEVLDCRLTVCAGYSYLTAALLQAEGIPALYAVGIGNGGSGWGSHAWNLVFVDGQWLWMDTTWGMDHFDAGLISFSNTHCLDSNYAASEEDTPSGWAQGEMWEAITAGLAPNDLQAAYRVPITREEFCRLAISLVEQTVGTDIDTYLASRNLTAQDVFTDTDNAQVLAAYTLGIVNGTSESTFSPDGSITRQEAATMLARTGSVLGLTAEPGTAFADAGQFAPWGAGGIAFVSGLIDPITGSAVMSGVGDGCFSPNGFCTREQAVVTILRLFHCAQEMMI